MANPSRCVISNSRLTLRLPIFVRSIASCMVGLWLVTVIAAPRITIAALLTLRGHTNRKAVALRTHDAL
jgi:hypothetical protein